MKDLKRLDEKGKRSDDKRKQSLMKTRNQYNQQKLAIKQALASVDSNKSKKIVFDDEEMVNGEEEHENHNHIKKSLFNDDDEEDGAHNYEKDFEERTQFLGKGGEQLMKLQSRYRLDPRFKLDGRFLDRGENNEETPMAPKQGDDERSWQLGIIEQVVGRKFETLPEPHKKKLRTEMLRFDPTKVEHQKFLHNVEKVAETFIEPETIVDQPEKQEIEVSKEQFYTVDEDFSKSLKRRGEGFSLLSMFGRADDEIEDHGKDANKYEEEILLKNARDSNTVENPFKFDSSESENEADETSKKVPTTKPVTKKSEKSTQGIPKESFFMFGDDERLKVEGIAFFRPLEQKAGEEPEDYDQVKNKLRLIINKKILKTRRSKEGFQRSKFKQNNRRGK